MDPAAFARIQPGDSVSVCVDPEKGWPVLVFTVTAVDREGGRINYGSVEHPAWAEERHTLIPQCIRCNCLLTTHNANCSNDHHWPADRALYVVSKYTDPSARS